MKKPILILTSLLLAICARADEGMWLIHLLNAAVEKNMQARGLQLSAGEIYNADAPGATIADAVVSMEFGCTGSMISDKGLLITNHHCAYGDIHSLSTDENNLLEKGFWAQSLADELPIKGKSVYFLKRVLDVTDQVNELRDRLAAEGQPTGMRKLSHVMEVRYAEQTGLSAWLSSMWSGEKYYMALYEVYRDVRLVAAPPVSLAAFGGDTDNWEWPQHKCDFAMYRVYASQTGEASEYATTNVPITPKNHLKISLEGISEGDFAMVIGYPGTTNRYSSAARADFIEQVTQPISTRIRKQQMEIIWKAMSSDPKVRLKYSDRYFNLSNFQELQEGELECYKRFSTVQELRKREVELQKWISEDPSRMARWGTLLSDLDEKYAAVAKVKMVATYYRETIVNCSRLFTLSNRLNPGRWQKEYAQIDLGVEKELFSLGVREFLSNVPEEFLGEYHKQLLSTGEDCQTIAQKLWDSSVLTDLEKLAKAVDQGCDFAGDPLVRFLRDVKMADLNKMVSEIEGDKKLLDLNREYTRALYEMRLDKGIEQYPDANSTMRLTYGRVSSLEPRDGVLCNWCSTAQGLLEKYDPQSYDFNMDEKQRAMLEANPSMPVNFITDNDITGGNSGSPVMNARGELIGLAFDGNKESLASDLDFVDGYNKCVCVDIRYVIHVLRNYAHLDGILQELGVE